MHPFSSIKLTHMLFSDNLKKRDIKFCISSRIKSTQGAKCIWKLQLEFLRFVKSFQD